MLRQFTGHRCAISLVLLSLLSGGAQASGGRELLKDPVGCFAFDSSLGNPAPPVTVWYYRPDKVQPTTRVVFLMHGSSRTGQDARDLGTTYGKKHAFVLLAPEFSEKNYPGAAYAFGNMLNHDGSPLPESVWAFAAIERIFDTVREALRLRTKTYDILGHSAGGQLVHRLVLFAPQLRFRRAVASSRGRYALPTQSESFPYGFKSAPSGASTLAQAFSRDFVLLLGIRTRMTGFAKLKPCRKEPIGSRAGCAFSLWQRRKQTLSRYPWRGVYAS